jgi:hypothetical protein
MPFLLTKEKMGNDTHISPPPIPKKKRETKEKMG